MTTTDQGAQSTLPPFMAQLLHDYAQKALTTAATALIGWGAMTPASEPSFVRLGLGVAAFVASCAWTYIAAQVRRSRLIAAALAPAPPK